MDLRLTDGHEKRESKTRNEPWSIGNIFIFIHVKKNAATHLIEWIYISWILNEWVQKNYFPFIANQDLAQEFTIYSFYKKYGHAFSFVQKHIHWEELFPVLVPTQMPMVFLNW